MGYLLLVSIVWGLSFPLVKGQLTDLNPFFLGFARMALALPLFLPFLDRRAVDAPVAWRLLGIGAVQYGFMYVFLFASFRHLPAHQVALFTVTTPLFVALFARELKRPQLVGALAAAVLAILGAAVIQYQAGVATLASWKGFLLIQGSNAAFAFGQVAYRTLRPRFAGRADHEVYAWLYLGAIAATLPFAIALDGFTSVTRLTPSSGLTLIYLGIIASGLCFFWWNRGAIHTRAASLAVFNNLKVPFAVLFSITLFGEHAPVGQLIAGTLLLGAALYLAERFVHSPLPVTSASDRKH